MSAVPEVRAMQAAPQPMNSIWRTIRGYILWQYERGTLHYDIMVTLILLFIFLSPKWIKFNDKPVPRAVHPSEVIVSADSEGRLIYQIQAASIAPADDSTVRAELQHVIAPISGDVKIVTYTAVSDSQGHIQSYRVVAQR